VRMPGEMDGIDMVQVFRKEKPSLKVVFITGYAAEEKLEQAIQPQRTIALNKPFSIDELNQALHKLLKTE
ncbi:response regulator, partial [Omnitrophica bacterium]|nr:response regulator [Candidatus Omnitrophota bacterium]